MVSSWIPPESVSLPPLGRIPLLRKPVRDQTLKNLQNNITLAQQAAAAAERWRALAAKGAEPEPKGSVLLEDDFKKANDFSDTTRIRVPIDRIQQFVQS